MAEQETAIVVGVGPGLGLALVRRLAEAGMRVAAAARDQGRVASLLQRKDVAGAMAYGCDATDPAAVESLFTRVTTDLAAPDLVVYNAGTFRPGTVLDTTPREFEESWRIGCLGGFLVGRAAAKVMTGRGHGTILFTGATASLRGGAGFSCLAVPKFGLRALAQSLARELGPKGVHVAHVIIDGQIDSERYRQQAAARGPDALLSPDAIAESYYRLHRQHRSAWTQELDLRPWVEKF